MATSNPGRRQPDPRRRDATVHRAILAATVELLEAAGFQALTIEAIAARAGVGKQTIYRWWPSKAAVVLEAYIAAGFERVPTPDTGTLTGDLEAILLPVFRWNAMFTRGSARANKGMMAEAQLNPDFHQAYVALHRSWWKPLRAVLARGVTRGELRDDVDLDALIDLMLGAAWYRILLEHAPLDDDFARLVIQTVVASNQPP